MVAVLAGFHATFADMVLVWWTSSTFNHCFLILPIAVYLGAQHRERLARTAPGTSVAGAVYAFANGLLWVCAELMSVAFFAHLAVVGMLIGVCWALIGNRPFRILLFPFLYLYFSVPEGEVLVPYLQDWTAVVLVTALRLTDIPVFLEGRYLSIPSGNFVVAEACSGINYLIATLAVATMFMYLRFRSPWRRAAFMLLAVAVPLIANGLRAYGIVMIAHMSDYRLAMGVDHFVYGWVFFGIVIFALFAIGNAFSDEHRGQPPLPEPDPVGAPRPVQTFAVLVLALAGAFAPRGALAALDSSRSPAPPLQSPAVTGWRGPEAVEPALGLQFGGADDELAVRYVEAGGREVLLEAVQYRVHAEGKELINQTHEMFDERRWRQLDHGARSPDVPGGLPSDVVELVLRWSVDGQEYLVWYWYETAYTTSANRLGTKLGEARARLASTASGSAFVIVRTPMVDREAARAVLRGFVEAGAAPVLPRVARD